MATRLDPKALRVYVVTTGTLVRGRSHRAIAAAAIEGGATAIQLRAPELDDAELLALATDLASTCLGAGVLFVVNDRIDVAVAARAAGAHLGQGDAPADARAALGPGRVLGISVADPDQARVAEAGGADYLGVTVWSTATKPEAVGEGLAGVTAIAGATRLPVVGIGGIDARNAGRVIGAGAAGVAVISAVAASPDPVAATRQLRELVDGTTDRSGGTA
ncbi:MAG: thiamine phosphate synthase [Actinomycetota bacterium]